MLPQSCSLANYYHEAFRAPPEGTKKKTKKKTKKFKVKSKYEMVYENDFRTPPELEIPGNPSAFAVFASIRLTAFDRWMRQATQEFLQSSSAAPIHDQSEFDSDTEDNSQSSTYIPFRVSKVVGIGLRSVFELIKESRMTHPALCTKALNALLDVLQGQSPEGLKSEPSDVIDPLFDLLLDLACMHGPETSVPNDGTHLTAIACACLLSLVVVRGDTGKYLAAAAALLMCPRALSVQNIQMPSVLSSLQKSVQGVLLGKANRPNWITHGVPRDAKVESFSIRLPHDLKEVVLTLKSMACDGQYLYIFTSSGLIKVGTGYGGTLKGHVYFWKPEFYPNDRGTLVFCGGNLYLKLAGRRGGEFLIVERSNCLISGRVPLQSRDEASSVVFSDGENLGTISPARDDGFVVRMLNQNTSPASLLTELPLKLARKCVDIFGPAPFDEEGFPYTSTTGNEEEVAMICSGKEFGLIRTVHGKVLYSGKPSSLGIKQAGVRTGKWAELTLTKSPKVKYIAVGHEGSHGILLTEDGSVFFVGTARRGEDGDQCKVRRQPKALKPKKMIKVEGHYIVSGACNNGSTALITKDGDLLMFGKDTQHADPSSGLVTLKNEFVVQVALGKAHAVVLTAKGQIYTFGYNNKFQCGHDFSAKDGTNDENSAATDEQDDIPEDKPNNAEAGTSKQFPYNEPELIMCPDGMHTWHDAQCMICTVCKECTGYSVSCLSSLNEERNPGQECGCGEGDSGCSVCGCCRICASEVIDNSELADVAGVMRLDLIFRSDKMLIPPRQRSRLQEQVQAKIEDRKRWIGIRKQFGVKGSAKKKPMSPPKVIACGSGPNSLGSEVSCGSESETNRASAMAPTKLQLPVDSPVVQIAAGLHHSVLLLQNGEVYTFGSNLFGQLGCGDILAKNSIQRVDIPCHVVHIAAGSNHTVVLTSRGEVYTFGNFQKGQLARDPPHREDPKPGSSTKSYSNPQTPWYCIPTPIPKIGPKHGRRATWVGASGDQTFLKIDESLINSVSISKSVVTANKQAIVLLPTHEETANSFKCLVIKKRDGHCLSFKDNKQVDFVNKIVCMDPIYNVLWCYNPVRNEIACYNIIASELQTKNLVRTSDHKYLFQVKTLNVDKDPKADAKELKEQKEKGFDMTLTFSPELSLPVITNCHVTRFQAAINLLCCLDTLTIAHDFQLRAVKEEIEDRQFNAGLRPYTKDDFVVCNRFENHGGGWGYSGHSVEAIRFMPDTDVLLGGFGIYGGRGEYTAKVRVYDIGPEGGEHEGDGDLLAEIEELQYECGPRQKYPALFEEPVALQAHRWYVAWLRISGPSSDCGSAGQSMVNTEDQVLFYFKSSKKSNNGTDVNAGQIPQILYKVITSENRPKPRPIDPAESVHVLSRDFSRTVTKECFASLLSLLQWSWNTFKWGVAEGQSIKNIYTNLELERLVYISRACLRLIQAYILEIYPNQITRKIPLENVHLAESVGDVRTLLRQILSDNLTALMQSRKSGKVKTNNPNIVMMNGILEECHSTFVACFHAFYPTAHLKWTCLCDLLSELEKETSRLSQSNSQRLLSAVLSALCAPSVRLRSTFPLLSSITSADSSLSRGLSPSDNSGLPIMGVMDSHYYPILVEQMSFKTQVDGYLAPQWQWKEVLKRLFQLVSDPIYQGLRNGKITPQLDLTRNSCHLLARVLAELVHQCNANEEELQAACGGRIMHMTSSRFLRINQSRSWNTGNGSPDAISFHVDRPGISIVGVGIYSGMGHYDYELELLEDQGAAWGDTQALPPAVARPQRWVTLETAKGTFIPEDLAPEIIEIRFEKAVPIKENTKYAIRLRNHGGRTNNGDGGVATVRGSDNTTFTFSTCSLSFNGTTIARGQIPILLYYSLPIECLKTHTNKLEQQSRKVALDMTSSIVHSACEMMSCAREKAEEVASAKILSDSYLVTTLMPLMLAHVTPLASDPRSAVCLLSLIQDILPHVSALNLMDAAVPDKPSISSSQDNFDYKTNTTSHQYTWLQSDHPYKPASVSNYRVTFPESVKWITLEFDPNCSTAQPEDSLQLYIPSREKSTSSASSKAADLEEADKDNPPMPYWPVLHRFTSWYYSLDTLVTPWPLNSIVLPGNEVIFSLETASDYLKDEKTPPYGFKCLIVGYEWPLPGTAGSNIAGLKHLEAELSFLGGLCARNLMKKEMQLPVSGDEEGEIDVEIAEEVAQQTMALHGSLLSKGLALSNPPSIQQALDGLLPYSAHSNERLFLRDFVSCVAGSSGGRLAQWLQPGSRVDPAKCEVVYAREEMRCGWPAIITVLTRDQYSDLVNVPDMSIEVKAMPIDKRELGEFGRKMARVQEATYGGLPVPPANRPFEPTIQHKASFQSISAMKAFQNYSFEEVRFASPPPNRPCERMMVRHNGDGTFTATWTPSQVGHYAIFVTIDGYEMEETFQVEVKDPPQGITPPNQAAAKKTMHQPSRLRKFVAKNSAGLRVRAHPSLLSEQIGIVHVNGTIAFMDELHNDDGVWLRLTMDTIRQYCNTVVQEAWCMQYNQHLGKTLLLPVEEPKSILDQVISDTFMRKLPEIQGGKTSNYQVIKCGASGHNIRSRPSLRAPPVGMLVLGNRIGVTDYTVNSDGYWVLLDQTTCEKFCFKTDGEAWSLAIGPGPNHTLYLGSVGTDSTHLETELSRLCKRGFDFSGGSSNFSFASNSPRVSRSERSAESHALRNPFVFGDSDVPKVPKREKKDSKLSSLPKWFKAEDGLKSEGSDLQQGSNGNGITPPGTPKRCQSPRGASPKIPSRSSSPVPIPPKSSVLQDSSSGSSQAYSSSRSIAGISPLASGGGQDFSMRRGSTPSDTCALVSSITCDLSASSLPPQEPPQVRELPPEPPSPCDSSKTSPPSKSEIAEAGSSPKTQQTGTQTSPENLLSLTATCGHFSIGSVHKDERILQKLARIERATQGKTRPKRSISPAKLQQLPSTSKMNIPVTTEAAKPAMSPSVAESLRAVFAAFLWHEGIVHDAMACASFLKFHPTLPKQGGLSANPQQEVLVDKRRHELSKEEKARQRHSVEVSNAGNYLHIQPSTLESLTRSAANACANRKKSGKYPSSIHEEAGGGDFPGGFHAPMSVLPPALKSLVYLWEELTTSCMQIVSHQLLTSSPVVPIRNTKKGKEINAKNDKEKTDSEAGGKKGKKKKPVAAANAAPEMEAKAGQKEKEEEVVSDEPDTQCELCGEVYPYPVTFHMLQSHPGCGKHAEGKGYNSGGTYCLGWAGNCGDGGKPNSSWYLLCEPCREKYTKTYRGGKKKGKNPKSKKCLFNKDASTPSTTAGLEPHVIMKNNAVFLLDLQSSAESGMSRQRRPSSMPSVSENNSPPDAGPFSPMPPFQCLQSLGSNLTPTNEPEFYEKVLRPQASHESSSGQRPLSEISISSDTDSDAGKGMRFHRSVSMGTNGIPWSKTGLDGRIVMMRKRNNSSSEIASEGGSSLLCNPSSALQKLVPKLDSSSVLKNNERNNMGPSGGLMLLQRPIMMFLMQQHDLDALQLAMKQALRKAMCRVYGMQALNWLIRSVTQPICLHDLLWWFVTAHTPPEPDEQPDEDNKANRKIEEQDLNVCEHPLSDITIAGDAVHPLPGTFHALLQTIADLMVLLPMGSALQQMAVRCWGLRFAPTDHSFLHRSQVFSNISKILSRSEELEDCTVSMHESHQSNINNYPGCAVECLKDLTSVVEIKASSRQAMIGSLTDGSTETFWESGDEDKNKTKSLTLVLTPGHHPHMICVHVDNCRDLGQKVSSITFYSGPNSDELLRLRVIEVETRLHGGWLNCPVFDHTDTVIRMELKGPDNSVRVRQIRVLGNVEGESLKIRKLYNSATIQQRNCEAETLRVFRLITALVFGKLLMGITEETNHNNLNDSGSASISESIAEPLEESNDLREHMVGILFSRSKLTHLQKQVIVHIVMAIRKETARVRDEWELMLCSSAGLSNSENSTDPHKNSDTYCFEMLSMVLALSGSLVGRTYIAYQGGLIGDLLSLLHTGSARVQRQVTSLLRRILPEISPDAFAKIMGCTNLPPKDFGIVSAAYNKDSAGFDLNEVGILDVFLSVIAKSLTVQVKVKGKSGSSMKDINTVTLATSIHPKDNLGKRWWLRGCVNRKLAEVMIHLIKDMAAGKMSDAWANVTKGAIAENILHLTHLSDEQRIPTTCLRTPTIWLALASLCVLDKDHVDGLSSGQWNAVDGQMAPPRPTCTNHDDGETFAIIQCIQCGNLCADCDRFLHLHRKTRNHQRQVCKEEEEAIKVELHEGCGRTKLFWLLALADSRTLKALIEYREGGMRNRGVGMSGVCRFCGATGSSGLLAIGNVCADHECQEYGRTACSKLLSCGHMCGGILGEKICLPCLHGCSNNSSLKQDADDMCMICFTEALSCAPAIQLKCGHVFHMHCCKTVLSKGWPGPRITFSFSLCPICKVEIAHPTLDDILAPVRELFTDVKRKALMRLEYEGLLTVEAIVTAGARFFNDAAGYAMDRYAYYVCYKCNKAYYGGEARCDAEVGENYDPTELVCGGCSDVARAQMCPKHGTDFLEYKCRYCCSVAVFFCFGTTHFCNPCHDDFQRVTNLSKHELPNCPAGPKAKQLDGDECPLHMKHPPTGEEFALGCGVCRNAHTF